MPLPQARLFGNVWYSAKYGMKLHVVENPTSSHFDRVALMPRQPDILFVTSDSRDRQHTYGPVPDEIHGQ